VPPAGFARFVFAAVEPRIERWPAPGHAATLATALGCEPRRIRAHDGRREPPRSA